jgi:hypothetical protein
MVKSDPIVLDVPMKGPVGSKCCELPSEPALQERALCRQPPGIRVKEDSQTLASSYPQPFIIVPTQPLHIDLIPVLHQIQTSTTRNPPRTRDRDWRLLSLSTHRYLLVYRKCLPRLTTGSAIRMKLTVH